ncbi:MAG: hypothetical protein ACO3MG_08935 [Saprospiraceae bacterium]
MIKSTQIRNKQPGTIGKLLNPCGKSMLITKIKQARDMALIV